MVSAGERRVEFANYPIPKQGPDAAYHNNAGSNPVLRGLPLAAAVTMYARTQILAVISTFVLVY